MTQDIVARLRDDVKYLDDIPPSIQSQRNIRLINTVHEAADLIDRLSCPAGDVVERVSQVLRDSVAYSDDAQNLSAFQFISNRDDRIAAAIVAVLSAQPQASRDSVLERVMELIEQRLCIIWMKPEHREEFVALLIEALSSPPPISAEEERIVAFLWKWVERGLFDLQISEQDCLGAMANHPSAPWNIGRWDVDHKPYAEDFYDQFPKARGDHNQPELPGDVGEEA